MKLKNVDISSFIPKFLQEDETAKAFIYAIQPHLDYAIENIKHASVYARIDELSEEVLDMLAEQFNIAEYNKVYDIDIKRSLIRNCMLIHHQRGTVASIEKVVTDIFGDAVVEEWFNYGGEPYHFKVKTSNASASDEMLAELDRVIKTTQNCRSHLESVTVELFQKMNVYVAATCSVSTIDTFICEK